VLRAFFKSKHPPKQWSSSITADGQMQMSVEEPNSTAQVLCRTCNNEWVSGLDRKASEALKPLINGKATAELDANAQATVAAWIFKCALVFDAVPSLST
jgi:hypothetical protein